MLNLRIELAGDDLICIDVNSGGSQSRKPLGTSGLARFKSWSTAYDTAVRARQPDRLPVIGREIAALLNGSDGWLDGCLESASGEVTLEIVVRLKPGELGQALLDVPWELLVSEGGFLAADPHRLFSVARRLGTPASPIAPDHGDMAVLFMAAEVDGQRILDYEREEIAFLTATRSLIDRFHLAVEESGNLDLLGARLAQAEHWEALHLTCHGEIGKDGPFLALETPEGALDMVTAERLCEVLGDEAHKPRLAFLSACRTAEQTASGSAPFTQMLIRSGVANAVGWDGSVHDLDATRFAEAFYRQLAGGRPVTYAAAVARREVLRVHLSDPQGGPGSHWHLARVYLGPQGGGSLCHPAKPTRPFRRNTGDKTYLDKANRRVPVATPAQFVGRRRPIQQALRAWSGGSAGVLIQGMGNLGKSSLAERIASRMLDHTVVVVFERYDARAVFDALVKALPEEMQSASKAMYEPEIARNPAALKLVLQQFLKGPFSGHNGTTPILLIVDDLERRLAEPKPGEPATPFKTPEDMAVFGAVIAAFRDASPTKSRLLITSRYTFALTDTDSDDLAARLTVIALPPMDEAQRTKQMLTAARLSGLERKPGAVSDLDNLEKRIKRAAGGNPGLQEILTRPLLDQKDRAAGIDAATRAVEAIEGYLGTGNVPTEESAAVEFFQRVSLDAFRSMLTPTETMQLRAATLFLRPVPLPVLEAAGQAAGISEPRQAIDRLQGLGLLDRYRSAGESIEGEVNPLARPLVPALGRADETYLATAVITLLFASWADQDGSPPVGARSVEIARLVCLVGGPPEIVDAVSLAGANFLFHACHEAKQALDLIEAAITILDKHGAAPNLHILRLGALCAERLGRGDAQDGFLKQALAMPCADLRTKAMLLFDHASRITQTGSPAEGEPLLREVAEQFYALGDVRERAVTMGRIADILQGRGEVEEALRIRREEQLLVYERRGDVRERAVTMGQIADILEGRGEVEEALRIHLEERLPVAQRMKDRDSIAHIRYCCACIRLSRGGWQQDEAAVIRDELAESYGIYLQLRHVEGIGTVGALFARILAASGLPEEALTVLNEAAAAFAKLQHTQGLAHVRALQDAIRKAAE